MQGKCERGRGSANADGAGAKVFAGDGCSQGRLSAPWPRFHGVDRADVYIIIRVCASYCGESALNPPTSPPISRRRPSPAPHSDTPFPSTSARPRSPDARPQAARCIPRRPHNPFSTEALRSPPHSDTPSPQHFLTPSPPRRPPAGSAMHSSPTSQPIPRRRPSPAPAQRHALPEHFRSPTQPRRTPAGCAMHSPPPSQPIPRSATPPPLPFRFGHKKTAPHSACAMPNVSVDRRCGRSFGWVSRALFAAVAGRWRVGVGLRPQPWALRSRRCGRVLRA